MFSFATDKFGLPPEEAAGLAAEVLFPPRLEKFHFSPFSDFTRLISGCFKVSSVTFRVFEKISGISSTPTLSDLACTKADLLNTGSSAIEMSSADTLPENSDSERFPTLTGRPSAVVRSVSSVGRKVFASMKKGIAMAMTMSTPTIVAATFRMPFIIRTSCRNGSLRLCLREKETLPATSLHALSLSLRVLQQFRRGNASGVHLLLACGAVFVVDAHGRFQFFLRVFLASHVEQNLSVHVVNVGAFGIESAGSLDL